MKKWLWNEERKNKQKKDRGIGGKTVKKRVEEKIKKKQQVKKRGAETLPTIGEERIGGGTTEE